MNIALITVKHATPRLYTLLFLAEVCSNIYSLPSEFRETQILFWKRKPVNLKSWTRVILEIYSVNLRILGTTDWVLDAGCGTSGKHQIG